jgi:hypothetical protein
VVVGGGVKLANGVGELSAAIGVSWLRGHINQAVAGLHVKHSNNNPNAARPITPRPQLPHTKKPRRVSSRWGWNCSANVGKFGNKSSSAGAGRACMASMCAISEGRRSRMTSGCAMRLATVGVGKPSLQAANSSSQVTSSCQASSSCNSAKASCAAGSAAISGRRPVAPSSR